ncbi:hypothetical protein ElyMa_004142900 [Elysia marginata]|uniref:Uncharacterized protein n=1 Tax=Elysia marginata TaxID=1093978 RepID=A0AAV4GEK3_9GAST|nr:hypothetical protein ElyMa_004142900 [Elysia marginata]
MEKKKERHLLTHLRILCMKKSTNISAGLVILRIHWCEKHERSFNYRSISRIELRRSEANIFDFNLLMGLDSSVGSGFAPWPRGRVFETQPSTVRAPTGWFHSDRDRAARAGRWMTHCLFAAINGESRGLILVTGGQSLEIIFRSERAPWTSTVQCRGQNRALGRLESGQRSRWGEQEGGGGG